MHWTDLLIIYLSCGAPFGVYFFLQNRKKYDLSRLLLSSGAAGLFWIAYAYLLWRKNIAKRLTGKENSSKKPEISLLEQQISVLQEQILQAFIDLNAKTPLKPGFFAFRDVLERYSGLTLAIRAEETIAGESDFEVFRIAGRKKKELPLAGKCLARKNSMRLKSHQCNAREDFLKLLAKLGEDPVQLKGTGKAQNFSFFNDLILELFELLDVRTLPRVQDVFERQRNEFTRNPENGFETSEVIQCQPPQAVPSTGSKIQSPQPPMPARALVRSSAE
jgi:hypothetical protein